MKFRDDPYNLKQNICRLFHVLVQFLLTSMNVRVASRVAEGLSLRN